jgi:hypothetical protein
MSVTLCIYVFRFNFHTNYHFVSLSNFNQHSYNEHKLCFHYVVIEVMYEYFGWIC